ncbi:MAG: oxidoreductase [Bacteroidetes bacterium]|nr:oxidoreductase [Bacteroidota bacterium]MBL7103741.1 oxidoreductase [Bacteroidales bacterium]
MENNEKKSKLNLAVYWGAACGGCCVSVLDVHEKVLDIIEVADFVFWPIALDTKYKDVEAMPDLHIDITLFNGAIRNSENEHLAKLLRQKSKILIAYGSCAQLGGIPGLANLTTKEELLKRVYEDSESTVNPDKIRPVTEFDVPEGKLTLPEFYNDVRTLDQVVDVDYYLPGCPPTSDRLVEVFTAVVSGSDLPPKGSVVGAEAKSLCDECDRKKSEDKAVKRFYRPWEIEDDGETCFIEQGLICMGPATRAGCGYRCIKGNSPCRGCYGPTPEITDPGAKMLSAIATVIDSNDPGEIEGIINQIEDPAGTFYRMSVPAGILRRKITT